jgi:hypothetical protein
MSGIRVPDAQYEAPTPTPEQAQVPLAKQPVANANMFGAAQAAAGVEAGAKVAGAAADIADKIIQEKSFAQTSQVFENRELMNEYSDRLMNDTGMHTVTDPDGTERQVPNGYALRTGKDKVSPDVFKAQMQQYQQTLSPDGKGSGWLLSVAKMNQRYTDQPISDSYGKLSAYNKDQAKREVAQTYQDAYSKSLLSSSNQPNMTAAINYTQTPLHYMLANGQVAPRDHIPAQEKNALDTMNNFSQNNIGKMTADDLKKQVDDAQKASGGMITDDIKNQAYGTIDKLNDAYQKQVKINQEHAQSDSVNEFASGVGSGKYNATNANAILADKNLPANVGQALYNAVMNVNGQKIASINKGGTMQDKLPLTGKSLGIPLTGEKNKESADAANYTLAIANSLNTKDATDKLVTAITSDKLDKTQLEVYTRTLALVGQYAPTETEHADGKTIDPKGVPQIAGLKATAEFANGKPGGTGLIKNYLDGIQAPNADPNQAKDAAHKTWRLDQYPMTSGNDNITHVVDDNSPTVRVNPRTMSNGKQAIVYPAARIKEKQKSMTVPNEA